MSHKYVLSLFWIYILCYALEAMAANTWVNTGSLNTARWFHTATLLSNNTVLVAGGTDNSSKLASTELYNPTTGAWAYTGSLHTARYLHTATLLSNGMVLVVGGDSSGSGNALTSAEIYNPTTGTWANTGSLNKARWYHTATLLSDGKVLVAGGENSSGRLTSAEIYNPTTGTWTYTGSMNTARTDYASTLLSNGMVLVAGGYGAGKSSELYNPTIGTWANTGSLNTAHTSHTSTLLLNGKVLVVGGYDSGNSVNALANAELYDYATGSWTNTGSLSTARKGHAATLLSNGMVLATGGYGAGTSTELYNPGTGTWSNTGSLQTTQWAHTATLLSNGIVLIAGSNNAELYTSANILQSITISPTSPSMTNGAAQQFTATGTYTDGSQQDITNSVTWNSSNTSVATINGSGLLTALTAGTTNVTASLFGETSPIQTLTITDSLLPVISSSSTATATVGASFTYQITASNSPTNFSATGLPTSGHLSINAGGLISGTPTDVDIGNYNITINATNAEGTGTIILSLDVQNVTSIAITVASNSATISWPVISGVIDYELSIVDPIANTIRTYNTSNTSYLCSGLLPKTTYECYVLANKSNGSSTYSAYKSFTTLAADESSTPAVPTNVTATSTQDSITVLWPVVSGAITYNVKANGNVKSTTNSFYTYTGLAAGTSYSYAVLAANRKGSSTYSASQSIMTLSTNGASIPSVPTNVTATATQDSITVSWNAINGATKYNISGIGGDAKEALGTSYTYTGLTAGVSYSYVVRAVNSNGSSAYSVPKSIITLPSNSEDIRLVKGLQALSPSLDPTKNWLVTPNQKGSYTYINCINNRPVLQKGVSDISVGLLRHIFAGLGAQMNISPEVLNNAYDIRMQAAQKAFAEMMRDQGIDFNDVNCIDSYTWSWIAETLKKYGEDKSSFNRSEFCKKFTKYLWSLLAVSGVPSVPTAVTATATKDSITVSWFTVDGADSYKVSVNGDFKDTADNNPSCVGTSCTYTNLSSSTPYDYAVIAKNDNGSSLYSASKWIVTLPSMEDERLAKGLLALSPSLSPTKNWLEGSNKNSSYTYINCINNRVLLKRESPADMSIGLLRHIFEGLGAQMNITPDVLNNAYDIRMQAAQKAFVEMMQAKGVDINDENCIDSLTWSWIAETLKKYGEDKSSFDRDEFWRKFDKHFWILFLAEFGLTPENSEIDNISTFLRNYTPITNSSSGTHINYMRKILQGLGLPVVDFGTYPNVETQAAIKILHIQAGLTNRDYNITKDDWIDPKNGIWQYLEKYANMTNEEKTKEKKYINFDSATSWGKVLAAIANDLNIRVIKNIDTYGASGTIIVTCDGATELMLRVTDSEDHLVLPGDWQAATTISIDTGKLNPGNYIINASARIRTSGKDYVKNVTTGFVINSSIPVIMGPLGFPGPTVSPSPYIREDATTGFVSIYSNPYVDPTIPVQDSAVVEARRLLDMILMKPGKYSIDFLMTGASFHPAYFSVAAEYANSLENIVIDKNLSKLGVIVGEDAVIVAAAVGVAYCATIAIIPACMIASSMYMKIAFAGTFMGLFVDELLPTPSKTGFATLIAFDPATNWINDKIDDQYANDIAIASAKKSFVDEHNYRYLISGPGDTKHFGPRYNFVNSINALKDGVRQNFMSYHSEEYRQMIIDYFDTIIQMNSNYEDSDAKLKWTLQCFDNPITFNSDACKELRDMYPPQSR
ncbi:exported hypothetical protein [Gammaproteobacteria bacterium]